MLPLAPCPFWGTTCPSHNTSTGLRSLPSQRAPHPGQDWMGTTKPGYSPGKDRSQLDRLCRGRYASLPSCPINDQEVQRNFLGTWSTCQFEYDLCWIWSQILISEDFFPSNSHTLNVYLFSLLKVDTATISVSYLVLIPWMVIILYNFRLSTRWHRETQLQWHRTNMAAPTQHNKSKQSQVVHQPTPRQGNQVPKPDTLSATGQ